MTPETSAERMVSKEVLRVKHAPDMNLMEAVRHFTFLLSKRNLRFANGEKAKEPKNLDRQIKRFSKKNSIRQTLSAYYSKESEEQAAAVSNDPRKSVDVENTSSVGLDSPTLTADVATAMFRESNTKRKESVSRLSYIRKKDRLHVIDATRRCLAWAHDKERPAVPG